ncbi:MAG: methyltransferase domain-containing protein [Candidatus Omnitrophica bacterium]|nr:methyltransferase domain-containing protein [Candidatus Omnitrophota bacterium]
MKNLFHYFLCPDCKASFFDDGGAGNKLDGMIKDVLTCANGHIFPFDDGIPDFTSFQNKGQDKSTVESFGFEWQWDNVPRTEEDLYFRVFEKPNVTPEFLKGKLVLDVGCGAGLQTKIMAKCGATVIGVDLSEAVRAAYHNNIEYRDRVCIARADIFHLPFAEETFDYIYCEGVLQHTKNPQAAFYSLARLLKKEGQIFATFYTRREGWFMPFLFFRQPLRVFLSRLPSKWCWRICWFSIPLNKIPILKHLFRKTIVLYDKRNPGSKAIWCLNYDFYGPHKYQFYFSPGEIRKIWQDAPIHLTILHSEYDYPLRGKRK